MPTVKLVSDFETLNDDRSLALKPNAASREREAVVDITFGAAENYATDGVPVDFATIRKFTRVYAVDIIHNSLGIICSYVPGTGAAGTIKCFGYNPTGTDDAVAAPAEFAADATVTNNLVLRVRIRGI